MNVNLKNSIPKLICGNETATAFLISENIAMTATHALVDFFEDNQPVRLYFNVNSKVVETSADPIILEDWERQQIIALKLKKTIQGIEPLICSNFKFTNSINMKCETYGYPPARSDEGTFIDLQVKNEHFAEDYKSLPTEWNLDLKKEDDIKSYEGVSGAPIIINGFAVGVLLKQVEENGEVSRLSAVSLYLYRESFNCIGVNFLEKENNPLYAPYLNLMKLQLEQQLENTISRMLDKNSINDSGLGFTFKFNRGDSQGKKVESYIDLLRLDESAVILSEPGGGKTYLMSMWMKDIIENPIIKENKTPIFLKARNWKRSFHTIADGIVNELKYALPRIEERQVEQDLYNGNFLLLIDGLDEVSSSLDLLVEELIKISKLNGTQILVTCRKENYHKQFYTHFSEYTIKNLDEAVISEYINKELKLPGWQVLHNIEGNLRSLIKNPLFLFMTVSILKVTGYRSLPKNKAELYNSFIRFLMEERNYQKGLMKPFSIDLSTKELILSEYSDRTFRELPDMNDFAESVSVFLGRDKVELAKSELLETGLIIEENGVLSFFHPSFHEYFLAFKISKYSDSDLINFLEKFNKKEAYYEVLIYLAGLLQKNNRQDILLDFLEKTNLYIYRKCLEARFDFSEQIKKDWSKDYMNKYFRQVRKSYLQLIENHFSAIRDYFYPWYSLKNKAPREGSQMKLIIVGSMNSDVPAVDFRFLLGDKNSEEEIPDVILEKYSSGPAMLTKDPNGNTVSVPIKSMSSGKHWFINLNATDMGLDSAREVALYSIKKQIAEILDKKTLFDMEPLEMMVMQIEKNLSKLPLHLFSVSSERHKRRPSLYKNSLDELVNVLTKENKIFNYADSLMNSIYYSSEDPLRMILSILTLKRLNIEPKHYLLPPSDIGWEQLNKGGGFIWELWSDKQLSKRIATFYEHYQISYRHLVENTFYSIKEYLPFYSIGPIRFNVAFYREKTFGGGVEVTWEPVKNIKEIKTVIEQIPERKRRGESALNNERNKEINESLIKLGRKNMPFFSKRNSALDKLLHDEELREEVYSQLEKDLSYVLGKLN
ncbi:NACHT domain-containing protein [Salimicrobium salexigens]|uniref:Predicted NTPase, NACHT family domain n=1 Tax=Salimicrobium salexigens TaxID=908941 RepID=A0ABY1L033_9BACI|nr:NACHT domain-containing protein [Salimicrobium salexigens]SIS99325.1 Predicted NTPase, NACHT family domain [Salimicrobium salexigens]